MLESTLSPVILWLIAAALLAILEAFTLGLTSIWFAGGALCAAITAALGLELTAQIGVFLAVSILLIIITRPLAKRGLNSKTEMTNIDGLIGAEAVVTEDIPASGSGQVRADGKIWTAISNGCEIKQGVVVTITQVRGVTLTVREREGDS